MKSLFSRSPSKLMKRRTRKERRRRLGMLLRFERLEDRRLLASDFVVNSALDLEDLIDDGIVDVDPNTPGQQLSLREAIKLANADANSTISFDLSGNRTISVGSQLPAIAAPTKIDASAQVGANPITLRTSVVGGGINGLLVESDGVAVHGLRIEGFGGSGILSIASRNATLELNEVIIRDNLNYGVFHTGSLRLNVGAGLSDDAVSVFRGNGRDGIYVEQDLSSGRAVVAEGNQRAGIFARLDITMFGGVTVSNNGGPGIQALNGEIDLNRGVAPDSTYVVEAVANGGPGLMTGKKLGALGLGSSGGTDGISTKNVVIAGAARIEGNGGWGIWVESGDAFINTRLVGGGGIVSNLTSTISNNGNLSFNSHSYYTLGGEFSAIEYKTVPTNPHARGGIWASQNIEARQVEVISNHGGGVMAGGDIGISGIVSTGNAGPGVQSIAGGIALYPSAAPDSEFDVVVMYNAGPGVMAGDEIGGFVVGGGGDFEDSPQTDVSIFTPAFIANNAGWGVIAARGELLLNMHTFNVSTGNPARSRIENNGNDAVGGITFLNHELDLATITVPRLYDRGGLWAAAGLSAANVDVGFNTGAGIVAGVDVRLIQPTVENNVGTGIQSITGNVEIINHDIDFESHIRGNAGHGIVARADGPNLINIIDDEVDLDGDITVSGPVFVTANAGWGLLAHEDIEFSVFNNDSRTSVIALNGDPALLNIMFSNTTRLPLVADRNLGNSGGILAGGHLKTTGEYRLVVSNNQGPGIVANGDVDLFIPEVTGNQGPGVQSISGTVSIASDAAATNRDIRISRNQGAGIEAGLDVALGSGDLLIADNGFSGVIAGRDIRRTFQSVDGPIIVTENGTPVDGLSYRIRDDGRMEEIAFFEQLTAAGLDAGLNMSLTDAFVTNNVGDGARADNDLFVERGQFCFNTGEAAIANAELSLIDVTDCETIVRNTRDSGFGSLRNAVLVSELSFNPTVTFDLEAMGPGPHVIQLESEIATTASLFLQGPGADVLTIDGGKATRLFSMRSDFGGTLAGEFVGLTLANGSAVGGRGGAIEAESTFLQLRDVRFAGNEADQGGAVALFATEDTSGYGGSSGSPELIIDDSEFANNSAREGGAVWLQNTGFDIENTTFDSNRAGQRGGALFTASNSFNVGLINSTTLSNNVAVLSEGGAWWHTAIDSIVNVVNTTFSGNRAEGDGGAIFGDLGNNAELRIVNVTITANDANSGGGLATTGEGSVWVENSIVAGNSLPDISANLIFNERNVIGTDPRLAPLSDNGGQTRTHALLADSPAIDIVDNEEFIGSLAIDQRGERRFGLKDAGAFETAFDFGDAPSTFPVQLDQDGARHLVGSLFFGSRVEGDEDGQPSSTSLGDDADGFDDEDGVNLRRTTSDFRARAIVNSSSSGFVNAWIDFNGNGIWNDVGEQILTDRPVVAGQNRLDFDIPDVAALLGVDKLTEPFETFARFRLSTQVGLSPTGVAPDGEVEDMRVSIDGAILPINNDGGGSTFRRVVFSGVPATYDPDVAIGYVYEVSSGPNFGTLELMPGFGDDVFTLGIDDGTGGFTDVFSFIAGEEIDFDLDPRLQIDGGISRFRITGIELNANVDPNDPLGFPTVLSFVEDGEVVFSQIPLVEFVNADPLADDDAGSTNEDTRLNVASPGLLANDLDPDPENLSLSVTAINGNSAIVGSATLLASGALLLLNADGSYIYDPNGAFESLAIGQSTTDTFTYTVTDTHLGTDDAIVEITISGRNDDPVAVDDAATTPEDTAVLVHVLTNDSDVDRDVLTPVIATAPSDGTASVNPDGTITYTPNVNFNGSDSFSYTVNDGFGGSATAVVNITVSPVNDVPIVAIVGLPASGTEGAEISLSSSIVDPDTSDTHILNWNVTKDGTAFATGTGINFAFTPDDNGSYVVTVTATDAGGIAGSAVATVAIDNVAPTAEITGPDSVTIGQSATFTLTATDASSVDQAREFSFAIDWDGDGTVDQTIVGPSGTTVSRIFNEEGDHDIIVTATDKDGSTSVAAILSVDVVRGGGGGGQPGTAEIVNGDLIVTGTDANDRITIRPDRHNPGQVKVRINRHLVGSFAPTGLIRVDAGLGDDEVYISEHLTIDSIVDGGQGDDYLRGGGGNDLLRGGLGNDELRATIGNDFLEGNAGDDLLRAGEGNDQLDGGDGNDELRGYRGNDILIGGAGDDLLRAGEGNDQLFGGEGNDELRGHRGNDLLDGGAGDDLIRGGSEGDKIDGGNGDDVIYGGSGDDLIRGGAGHDTIKGGGGNDVLLGGDGNDDIDGASGSDLLIGGFGSDLLHGRGDDDILIAGYTDYDTNDLALNALMQEWSSCRDYTSRVTNITSGLGYLSSLGVQLSHVSVHDDDEEDILEGDGGLDLFFYNFEGVGVKDIARDYRDRGSKIESRYDT